MSMTDSDYHPLVSVIIPVYNAASTLQRTLESVFTQSYPHVEIIAVNDGSTDDSLALLRQYAAERPRLDIIDQTNHGQGYSRNRAIEQAAGEYVLFLDADDWLEPAAIDSLVAATNRGKADVVHCGWRAGNVGVVSHRPSYQPKEIFSAEELRGKSCDEFLRLHNYFSVNNLFRRQFLLDKHITFGEGYIYEDNEFMVAVANRAEVIRFVDKELYNINFHGTSSTRGTGLTDKHSHDFLLAAAKSFDSLEPRLVQSRAYLANYFLEKFIIYYQQRVPRRYKRAYRREFVDIMSQQRIEETNTAISKFLLICLRLQVFTRHRHHMFWFLLMYKTQLVPLINR